MLGMLSVLFFQVPGIYSGNEHMLILQNFWPNLVSIQLDGAVEYTGCITAEG